MPRTSTSYPPGAPINNNNHLKLGLYSTRIFVKADDEFAPISEDRTSAELALLRANAFEGLFSDRAITPREDSNLIRIARALP